VLPALASFAAASILASLTLVSGPSPASPAAPAAVAAVFTPARAVSPAFVLDRVSSPRGADEATNGAPPQLFGGRETAAVSGMAGMVPVSIFGRALLMHASTLTVEPAFSAAPEHLGGARAMLGIVGRF
jgi:hypothetical protein